LADGLGLRHLKLINDFTALALALPLLQPHELRQVGGQAASAAQALPLAVIGPGTGLGVAGLLPDGRGAWVPISGEGGHVTLAAQSPLQWRLLARLARRHGHVSAERVLSGPGLGELHRALSEEAGRTMDEPWPAPQIVAQALQAQEPTCLRALELFAQFLGAAAGDLALTLGARGGVYLGGGIVPRLGEWFHGSGFRAAFEAKGRFAEYLRPIAVWVIDSRDAPALRGAALALDKEGLT
jgi:glucokinase